MLAWVCSHLCYLHMNHVNKIFLKKFKKGRHLVGKLKDSNLKYLNDKKAKTPFYMKLGNWAMQQQQQQRNYWACWTWNGIEAKIIFSHFLGSSLHHLFFLHRTIHKGRLNRRFRDSKKIFCFVFLLLFLIRKLSN